MSVPYLAQAADHEQLRRLGGGIMRIMLDGEKTDGQLTMLRSAAQGGSASPVHVHADEDEIVVLLRGSGIFWAGEQRYELAEGGVAFLPRNIPHAYRFTSDTVDMPAICTPAGTEEFFRAAGWDLSRPQPAGWGRPAWRRPPLRPGRPSSGRR
ncbi:MAG TPA: cupin domain-containing protein [Streptosporangiaceae bacterium]|jgi:quercetin dioxygenase-like cupin family protein